LNTTRVGLDGRALTNQNRLRGIGLYTARLVESLLKETGDYEFVVFGYGRSPQAGLLEKGTADKLDWWELTGHEKLPYHELLLDHLAYAKAVRDSGVSLFHGVDHNLSPYIACPSLVTVHDLIPLVMPGPYLGPRHLMWVKAHGRAARKARVVVTDSEHTRRDVERLYGIPGERIQVIYAGVDQDHRPVEDRRLIKKALDKYGIEKPFFLSTGGLDPRKNIGNALLAFKMFLMEDGGDFQFVLCGDPGRFKGYVNDEITDLGLRGRVVLTGFVPNEDLPPLYSQALALIFVSLYEGFGLPPLESMKYETPVLTSKVSSIPEVVGDAGLYVDPLEPADMAAGMSRLASDEGLRRELVQKGLRRAPRFTWEKTARQVLSLYPRVLGEAG
jgi:glycosyltransferase involved in cell wall biosynthesis